MLISGPLYYYKILPQELYFRVKILDQQALI